MAIVAGIGAVNINGKQLTVGNTVTVSPLGQTRESVVGMSGNAGIKITRRAPWIECEVITTPDFKITDFDISDATVQADFANGRTYILRNGALVGEPELAAGDGTCTLRYEGTDCKEI